MNRIITTLFTIFIIQLLVVNKTLGNEGEVKDCFEKLNRATFALNMGLDKVIFKPITTAQRNLHFYDLYVHFHTPLSSHI